MRSDGYDGVPLEAVRRQLGVPQLHALASTGSVMDDAHRLASDGAPVGIAVVADAQTAGRGRNGRRWHSAPGAGVWLAMLFRPPARAADVLALRIGLRLAAALDDLAPEPIGTKWPNDLFVCGAKLAGVLIEARWRQEKLEWVVVGLGVNVSPPPGVAAAALRPGTRRIDVLRRAVRAIREAESIAGSLSAGELAEFERRDVARGRQCVAPVAGVVQGISPAGELVVRTAAGDARLRTGSLVLAGDGP